MLQHHVSCPVSLATPRKSTHGVIVWSLSWSQGSSQKERRSNGQDWGETHFESWNWNWRKLRENQREWLEFQKNVVEIGLRSELQRGKSKELTWRKKEELVGKEGREGYNKFGKRSCSCNSNWNTRHFSLSTTTSIWFSRENPFYVLLQEHTQSFKKELGRSTVVEASVSLSRVSSTRERATKSNMSQSQAKESLRADLESPPKKVVERNMSFIRSPVGQKSRERITSKRVLSDAKVSKISHIQLQFDLDLWIFNLIPPFEAPHSRLRDSTRVSLSNISEEATMLCCTRAVQSLTYITCRKVKLWPFEFNLSEYYPFLTPLKVFVQREETSGCNHHGSQLFQVAALTSPQFLYTT